MEVLSNNSIRGQFKPSFAGLKSSSATSSRHSHLRRPNAAHVANMVIRRAVSPTHEMAFVAVFLLVLGHLAIG